MNHAAARTGRRRSAAAAGAATAASLAILLMAMFVGVGARPVLAVPLLTVGSFPTPPMAVGGSHICALPGDGTVLCWGDNTLGQIGNGRVTDPHAPAGDVQVQQTVVADAAGAGGQDCVDVTADGAVLRCHGSASLVDVTAIAAGFSHTCALLADTTVKCWGSNAPVDGGQFSPSLSGGELGDGSTIARPVPGPVIAGPGQTAPLSGVRALSSAAGYTCALLDDGTAKCWGNAPQAVSTAPIAVMADATTPLAQIAAISAGDRNACAALVDGSVVCWGDGYLGDQLSNTPRDGSLPVRVTVAGAPTTTLGGIHALTLGHNVFNGPNGFGFGHSCALNTSHEVLCWGVNDVSQLGNGSNGLIEVDSQRDYAVSVVAAPGSSERLTGVTAIAAGGYFTCALADDGTVKCWGLGLGGDSFEGGGAPVPLAIDPNATATSKGGMVLAHVTDRSALTAVATPLAGTVALAAGGAGVCATLADQSLWCANETYGLVAVPGVAIEAPSAAPGPTPAASTPGATGSPPGSVPSPGTGATGPEGVVGSWENGHVTIAYKDGGYLVTHNVGFTVAAGAGASSETCQVAAGTVTWTFSGSGGSYDGQAMAWRSPGCQIVWLPAKMTWSGDSFTVTISFNGQTSVWHRTAAGPGTFRNSIPLPWQVNLSPEVVLATLAFTGGVIILLPFPGALFNSTLESNYAEILRRARRGRRRVRNLLLSPWFAIRARLGLKAGPARLPLDSELPGPPVDTAAVSPRDEAQERHDFWWTPLGVGLFIVATAVLSGFLDPGFGINAGSLATLAGMLIGLVAVLAAFELPVIVFYRRHRIGFWFRALPATIAVSVVCVLISRLTDFQPGYLYGLIITTAVATRLSGPAEGRLTAISVASALAAAMVAWFGLAAISPLTAANPDPGPLLVIVQTVLTMIVAAGIETAAFGLLPMAFLSGPSVRLWNKPVWAALLVFGWFALGIIILNPQNGYLSDSTRTPLFTIVGLLAFFSLGSVAFWAYFRRYRRNLERSKTLEA